MTKKKACPYCLHVVDTYTENDQEFFEYHFASFGRKCMGTFKSIESPPKFIDVVLSWVKETFGAVPSGSKYEPLVKTNQIQVHENTNTIHITFMDVTALEYIGLGEDLAKWISAQMHISYQEIGFDIDWYAVTEPRKSGRRSLKLIRHYYEV